MNKIKIFIFFVGFSFFINPSFSFQELDRIIAIVNQEPITARDLEKGINKALLFFQTNNIEPPQKNIIQKKVLDELVEKKLLEDYANQWNIKVTLEDTDRVVGNITTHNKISIEEFKQSLQNQNSNYEEFIDNLKYEILLKKIKNQEIASKLNISAFEVQKHKKKLAKLKPDIYNLSHILLKFPPDPSAKQKEEKRELSQKLYQKLKTEDFTKIAYEYSDAPDSNQGGSLGEMSKNDLPEIFIAQIDGLQGGEISLPFESANGIHIIKINSLESINDSKMPAKKVQKYNVRQIVIKTSEIQSENEVIKKLNRLKNEIENGGDFETIAKKYSEDSSSVDGGKIGWISEGMDQKLNLILLKIDKNQISEPFQTPNGWNIIQYTDTKFEDIDSENIDNKIKMDLINERTELFFEDWISALKAEAFIEIRNE